MWTVTNCRVGRTARWCLGLGVLATMLGCGADGTQRNGRSDNLNSAAGTYAGASAAMGGAGGASGVLGLVDNPDPNLIPMPVAGSAPPVEACTQTRITASRILPTVMIVLDGSQSMTQPHGEPVLDDAGVPDPAAPALPSRWNSVREALVGATGVVPNLQGLVRFGLALYGTQPTCPLPLGVIDPALNNGAAITSGVPLAPPGLTTPTGLALDEVVNRLPDPTMVLDGPPIGPQIILLATDGNPNDCDPPFDFFTGEPATNYQPSIDAALKAQAKHLKMYVVSVGRDAAAQHLQEMANLGADMDRAASPGAEVYYPEDPATLTATLEALIGAELSCDLTLTGKGVKLGSECTGTVTLSGTPLECNGENGFELKDSLTISLKGTTCETFKSSVDQTIEAMFPCEALIVE